MIKMSRANTSITIECIAGLMTSTSWALGLVLTGGKYLYELRVRLCKIKINKFYNLFKAQYAF